MYIFNEVVGPVFVVIGLGYLFNHFSPVKVRQLSHLFLYVLSPSLIFTSLIDADITAGEFFYIALFAVILASFFFVLSRITGFFLRWGEDKTLPLELGSIFINAGTIGLPILFFAYGPAGVHIGAIFLLIHSLLHYTFGVFLCARQISTREALKSIFRLPMPYAALAGLLIKITGMPLPTFLWEGVSFLGDSALALGALILGMQLTRVKFNFSFWPEVSINSLYRLILSPLVAVLVLNFLPLDPTSRGALILQAATPTSITVVIIATEFNARPELVASMNLVTTFLSMFTLPLVLGLLGG